MPCYKPIPAYAGPGGVKFKRSESFGIAIELPCQNCIGCRMAKAQSWAIRCVHEAQMHGDNNAFITLTYDDYHLPTYGTLVKSHFQKFIRSLRKRTDKKIRYYMCGEYGTTCPKHQVEKCKECGEIQRPHYHAILFGYAFPDKEHWMTRRGEPVYRSKLLERTWHRGNSEIGSVTYKSASYVARYILKKQNGNPAIARYGQLNTDTGEIEQNRIPEYTAMSLKDGIGKSWFDKYGKTDVFPQDFVVTPDYKEVPVPSYYRDLLKTEDPILYEKLRRIRVEKARSDTNNRPERLAVREEIQIRKEKRLIRQLK